MKTIIKIHDTEWFREHCKIICSIDLCMELRPRYASWEDTRIVSWISGENSTMSPLEGRVLEAVIDCGNSCGAMNNARYMAGGYYIPNWAIEWIKEEQDA
jgi:hypothetical protein